MQLCPKCTLRDSVDCGWVNIAFFVEPEPVEQILSFALHSKSAAVQTPTNFFGAKCPQLYVFLKLFVPFQSCLKFPLPFHPPSVLLHPSSTSLTLPLPLGEIYVALPTHGHGHSSFHGCRVSLVTLPLSLDQCEHFQSPLYRPNSNYLCANPGHRHPYIHLHELNCTRPAKCYRIPLAFENSDLA